MTSLSKPRKPSREYALLDQLKEFFNRNRRSSWTLGAGDDSAVRICSKGEKLIATGDTLIEDVDFSLSFMSFAEIGYKAIAVNVSDCAAMGALPESALVQLVFPGEGHAAEKNIRSLYNGIGKACKAYDLEIIGGDLSKGPCWMIAVTMTGRMDSTAKPVLRTGIKHGDVLWASGTLGDSAAGLAVLKKWGREGSPEEYRGLVRRHCVPEPRVEAGVVLARSGRVTGMLDISDGIAKDCATLCYENRLGIVLDLPGTIFSSRMEVLSKQLRHDPVDWVLNGGEDFELLFAAPKLFDPASLGLKLRFSRLGVFDKRVQGVQIIKGNRIVPVKAGGWDHLR